MNDKTLTKFLSAYLDDALSREERSQVERLLATSSEARTRLKELRAVQDALRAQPRLDPSPFFWSRLSHRIETDRSNLSTESLLPVARRYAPAFILIALAAVAFGTMMLVEHSTRINQFVSSQAKTVRSFYEATLGTTLFPFFSDVSNDDVLTFAVGGYVPVKNTGEVIEFGNNDEKKYWVKVRKQEEVPAVALDDFSKAVDLRPDQEDNVKRVLARYRPQLEQSVLHSGSDTMAIASAVWDMNNAILVDMARTLDKVQREQFEKWVAACNPKTPVQFRKVDFGSAEKLLERVPQFIEKSSFVVLTPETTFLRDVHLDLRESVPPRNVTVSVTLPPRLDRHARSFVVRKSERPSASTFVFDRYDDETNAISAEPVVLQIVAPDESYSYAINTHWTGTDSLLRQFRRIRMPRQAEQVVRMVTREAPQAAEKAMHIAIEQVNRSRQPIQREFMRVVNQPPPVPPPPSMPRGWTTKTLNVFIDSVVTIKMRDMEKALEFKLMRSDSLARFHWDKQKQLQLIEEGNVDVIAPDTSTPHPTRGARVIKTKHRIE